MNINIKSMALVAIALVLSTSVNATPITFDFAGTISSYQYNSVFTSDPFAGAIGTGVSFSGSVTFDPDGATRNGNTSSTTSGIYIMNTGISALNINVGGLTFSSDSFDRTNMILEDETYFEGSRITGDRYRLISAESHTDAASAFPELPYIPSYFVNGESWEIFDSVGRFELIDLAAQMLSGVDLLTTPPDISGLDQATFSWINEGVYLGLDCDEYGCYDYPYWADVYSFDGQLTSLTVSSVPIPAAIWLFGSGLLGLIGLGRCKS